MSLKKGCTIQGTKVERNVWLAAVHLDGNLFGTPTVDNQPAPQPLRVMILQNVQHLLPLPQRRPFPAQFLIEVDDQRQILLARGHEIDRPLQHEDQMFHLLVAPFRVLLARVEVEAGPAGDVVARQDLFARGVFGRYVFRGVLFETVLLTPCQCTLEPDAGLVDIPLGGAEVAEEAFASQPHAVRVGEGMVGWVGRRGGFGGP